MTWLLFSCALGFKDCRFVAAVPERQCRAAILINTATVEPMVCIGPNAEHVQSLFYAAGK